VFSIYREKILNSATYDIKEVREVRFDLGIFIELRIWVFSIVGGGYCLLSMAMDYYHTYWAHWNQHQSEEQYLTVWIKVPVSTNPRIHSSRTDSPFATKYIKLELFGPADMRITSSHPMTCAQWT